MITQKYISNTWLGTLIFLSILLSNTTDIVKAQTLNVDQPHHELKVYKDLESHQLFWPKALPVYVWLSTSTEQNAPKHQLTNASLHTSEGNEPLEQAKIDLELSGNQFMRWINYETKDTLLLQFQSDGIKPVSTITLTGAENHRTENVFFFGKGLKASFEGEDVHSGIENIYVSVNGGSFSPYFGTYDFNQEKTYTIFYYAVDNVGNVEPIQKKVFSLDLTSPTSKHHLDGVHQGAILSSTATISLTSSDELSGVKYTSYSIDGSSNDKNYTSPISVSALGEGEHTLYYTAIDEVGNKEDPNAFNFYLDRTSPTTTLHIKGDQYSNSQVFVSSRTQYHLESKDNKTGVNTTHYQINDNKSIPYQKRSFQLPESSSDFTLSYWSTDNVGNIEEKNTSTLILDTSAPISSHVFNGTSFTQRGSTWIPSSTTLTLHSTDKSSGIQKTQFSIEGEIQDAVYSTPLSFSSEQKFSVTYWALDNVNNRELNRNLSIIVDNTPPELIINFSSAKIGSANASDGSVLDQYPINTTMYLAATDASSGSDGLWFSINDGKESPFTSALNFSEYGEQKVLLRATDNVGNETTQTLRFIISE